MQRCLLDATSGSGPCENVEVYGSQGANDSQRKEEVEDNVSHYQNAVDCCDARAKSDLTARSIRRRSRVSHHVEAVKNKRQACHREQPRDQRCLEDHTADRGLGHESDKPRQDQRYASCEASVEQTTGDNDYPGQEPVADPIEVFSEMVRRWNADPGEQQQRHRDAEVGGIVKVAILTPNRRSKE